MDISLFIRERLKELGLDQRQLAEAVEVTDSYVSQLLARKKPPPAPARTDLYDKIGRFLGLPGGKLEAMAEEQRLQTLKMKVLDTPQPLVAGFRSLILRKCAPHVQREVQRIFEKDSFGELERLVTQKMLDVTQALAREELRNEEWMHALARERGWTYEQMRVAALEFLDADILAVSSENCTAFVDPMLHRWEIDLKTFAIEITLNPRIAASGVRQFQFVEKSPEREMEPGLVEFLANPSMSGDAKEEEIAFLSQLRFGGRRPTSLYFYRELQNLRDPLHFEVT